MGSDNNISTQLSPNYGDNTWVIVTRQILLLPLTSGVTSHKLWWSSKVPWAFGQRLSAPPHFGQTESTLVCLYIQPILWHAPNIYTMYVLIYLYIYIYIHIYTYIYIYIHTYIYIFTHRLDILGITSSRKLGCSLGSFSPSMARLSTYRPSSSKEPFNETRNIDNVGPP